ncbi:MAG: FdhF/YdeP family oxidoreductase [Micromonosporaceae bacterium]|nr:FdhF/YdeP family oxidoreductase [Micromonosporaceae bacterium]
MSDDEELVVKPPQKHAAGLPAVRTSVSHAYKHMGLRRGVTALRLVNQTEGFDCPGCAWPEPGKRHVAEFCENGVKAVAEEATNRTVDTGFFRAHPIDDLAKRSGYWLGQQGRLTRPMFKDSDDDRYRPVSWQDAIEILASELRSLDDPDEAVFYTSGRTSNEAAFAYQLFVRKYGTNNLPDCSNMCHESSGTALTETIGVSKGSVTLEDVDQADLIFVVGQNPGTNHPRMLTALERAKRNGAQIVAVNPLPEAGLLRFKNPQRVSGLIGRGTALADLHLHIRVNGDLALFRALNQLLLQADVAEPGSVLDQGFIERHTDRFERFTEDALLTSWPDVEAATGLTAEEIGAAHRMVLESKRIIVCWAMGLTQHRNAVATIREVVNFLLLRGNIGRPGAGVCPVRGHSNVQGDRTMGIYEKPPAWIDALGREFEFAPPTDVGLDTVNAIRAIRAGRVKVFVGLGGNFVSATPDTEVTEAAMRKCRLTVQISTKLNRSHVVTGERALILPTLGRTDRDLRAGLEQVVSVEDSMGIVHASRGVLEPPSGSLFSEVAIICRLARAVLDENQPWREFESDYATIRDRIEAVVPGFKNYNRRLAEPGGFTLPHAPRDRRSFPTSTGRAQFTVNPLEVLRVPPGRLILQTIRSHDQYNTTIYGNDDRYRGIRNGRRVVLVNRADLAELGIADGELVDLVSEWVDGVERRAQRFHAVEYPTARGCCAAYFPETNVLVPLDSTAEGSNTPTSKSVIVRLEPAGGA